MSSFLHDIKKDRLALIGIVLFILVFGIAAIVSQNKTVPVTQEPERPPDGQLVLTEEELGQLAKAMTAIPGAKPTLTQAEHLDLIRAMSSKEN